jgi:transposase
LGAAIEQPDAQRALQIGNRLRIAQVSGKNSFPNQPRFGSRGGLTNKIHALVDTNGLPVRLALTAGEADDNRLADKLLSRLEPGAMLLADRGYDADWIRALAARKGAFANIPPRRNRKEPSCFSPCLYRARNLVERFFNKIKHYRRVATRYDKRQQSISHSSSWRRSSYGCAVNESTS